jgi:hypothetical protein
VRAEAMPLLIIDLPGRAIATIGSAEQMFGGK